MTAPATTPTRPRRKLTYWLAWPFVLAVGFFWWQTIRGLELGAALAQVRGREGWLLLALVMAGAYLLGQAIVWRQIVSETVVKLAWWPALKTWMVSNVARYLPGSVWHLVGRVMLGQAAGVRRSQGALAVVLEQSLQLLSAMLIVVASLPFWPNGSIVSGYGWLAALIPLGLVVIHPRIFFPLLNFALRLVRQEPVPATISYPTLLRYTLAYVLVHLTNGLALVGAVYALGITTPAPAVLGAALFAWTIGYLTIVAPGGLGMRELLVTQALAPLMGVEGAAVAALLWRGATIITEAAGAIIFSMGGSNTNP